MPVLRNTPNMGGRSKKTMQSDDAQAGVVQPTNNTAWAKEQLAPSQHRYCAAFYIRNSTQ